MVMLPPPQLITVPSRIAYTKYKRSKFILPTDIASTAGPLTYLPPRSPERTPSPEKHISWSDDDEKKDSTVSDTRSLSSSYSSDPSSALSHTSSSDQPPSYTALAPTDMGPTANPIAILPQYIAQEATTIIMTQAVLTLAKGVFTVKDSNGADLFVIKADKFSLSNRKHVHDAITEQHLFTIRYAKNTVPRMYYVEDPTGATVLDVEGKFAFGGKSKAEGHFVNAVSGAPVTLSMQGRRFNKGATIKDHGAGAEIAQIVRQKRDAKQLLSGRPTYAVTVVPGADISLIMAMCVCLDERGSGFELMY